MVAQKKFFNKRVPHCTRHVPQRMRLQAPWRRIGWSTGRAGRRWAGSCRPSVSPYPSWNGSGALTPCSISSSATRRTCNNSWPRTGRARTRRSRSRRWPGIPCPARRSGDRTEVSASPNPDQILRFLVPRPRVTPTMRDPWRVMRQTVYPGPRTRRRVRLNSLMTWPLVTILNETNVYRKHFNPFLWHAIIVGYIIVIQYIYVINKNLT